MLLNRDEILEEIKEGEIKIDPFNIENLGPNSYDLTVADEIKILENSYPGFFYACPTEQGKEPSYRSAKLPFFLLHERWMRGATREVIGVRSRTCGVLCGRSNLSRFPLDVKFGPLVDTGYEGVLSFAIFNHINLPVKISPGLRILQIKFFRCNPPSQSYFDRANSKNRDQHQGSVPGFSVDKEHRR